MSKTQLEELNTNIYDFKNKDDYDFKIKKGLTKEIVDAGFNPSAQPSSTPSSEGFMAIEEDSNLPF